MPLNSTGLVQVTLSYVPAGYNVVNSPPTYVAYCAQLDKLIAATPVTYQTTLISSLTLGTNWQQINYLLNHYPANLNLQIAIWIVLGYNPTSDGYTVTPTVNNMVADAQANYASFVLAPSTLVAVKCVKQGDAQDFLIVLTCVGPGLTPGFWKHNVGVALDIASGAFSDPVNSPFVTKATIGTWLHEHWINLELKALYDAMNTRGGGATGAATRNNAANVFNIAAGLATL